jgi:hypothetical protein
MQAKFIKATLTFENGSTKEGFAEMVQMNDSKVKFRLTEKGEIEKIISEDLKKIIYTNDDGRISIAEQLFINTDKGEKGIKKTDKKYWLYVVYSRGIKLAVDFEVSTFSYNPKNGTSTGSGGGTILYMGNEKEDGVFYVYYLSSMLSVNINMDKAVRNHSELLFKSCPKFIEAVNAENFKKNTLINKLIELYETNNCNKTVNVESPKKASSKKIK